MQLYFIRHGQSINNANYYNDNYKENHDPFLTEKGLEQAEVLARYLKEKQPITDGKSWNVQNQHGFGLARIYASLMERAAMAAAPSARALGIPFTAWKDIHEEGGIYAREKEKTGKVCPASHDPTLNNIFPN